MSHPCSRISQVTFLNESEVEIDRQFAALNMQLKYHKTRGMERLLSVFHSFSDYLFKHRIAQDAFFRVLVCQKVNLHVL
jgi:hypothetical protein